MAKLTITLEGEPGEDLRAELLKVLLANGQMKKSEAQEIVDWTPDDFGKFWASLRPTARKLLPEIAKHAPTYSFDELRKAVGMKGLEVAGSMSSVGHQQRQFASHPPIVTRDWNARVYHMDMRIARWTIAIAAGQKLA